MSAAVENDAPEYVEVVTRYGGHKHLAVASVFGLDRHRTLCMGTSSWTLHSWRKTPDHPLLTTEQIEALPACPACAARLARGLASAERILGQSRPEVGS